MSQTITEFLEARIAEDEDAESRKFRSSDQKIKADFGLCSVEHHSDSQVIIRRWDGELPVRLDSEEFRALYTEPAPDARMLAECAAKRAIAGLHRVGADQCDEHNGMFESIPCPTIRALAAVYADHPDYREDWA